MAGDSFGLYEQLRGFSFECSQPAYTETLGSPNKAYQRQIVPDTPLIAQSGS